jgi:LPXTG-site transpeptidase (sortase) family protein
MTTLLSAPQAPEEEKQDDPRAGGPRAARQERARRRPAHALDRSRSSGSRFGRLARSRWTRYGLPCLAVVSALVAVAALAFPFLSDLYASHRQHALAAQLDDPAIQGQIAKGTVGAGRPIGRIVIPAIGLNMVMVQGVDTSALAEGPGHYPGTPMPCSVGDVAIAGHRTTFLHPFSALDELVPGDVVRLETPRLSCEYVVTRPPFSVLPSDVAVVADTPGSYTLTLTTCTPRGSASHRLIVKGVMVPGSAKATKTFT